MGGQKENVVRDGQGSIIFMNDDVASLHIMLWMLMLFTN